MNSPASAQNTPQRVLLVGAGGIGSHLTDLLCRGLHGHALDLTLMDGDVVEERNLAHQRFQPNDIGRAKADVLAETHAKTGHNVTAWAEDQIMLRPHAKPKACLRRASCRSGSPWPPQSGRSGSSTRWCTDVAQQKR